MRGLRAGESENAMQIPWRGYGRLNTNVQTGPRVDMGAVMQIDWSRVDDLRRDIGDDLAEVVALFLEECDEVIPVCKQATVWPMICIS